MESTESAITQDGCQEQEAREQMPAIVEELQGQAQPTQGIVSNYPRTVDTMDTITESKQVLVHITDTVRPLTVELCSASSVQTTPCVTSVLLSGQVAPPPCTEVCAPMPVQTSACVPIHPAAASFPEQLTSQLSPPPPPSGMFTSIPAQTLSKTAFGQSGVAQPTSTVTRSYPAEEFLCLTEQVPATQPTQSPLTAPTQSSASPAVHISALCCAPLPAETPPPTQWVADEAVGSRFEECLEEVGVLEHRRDELVRDLLQLEQPMMEAVRAVQADLAQAYGLLTRAQLQLLWLQEDVRKVKRRLLNVTRHSIQSQVDLSALQYEVAQSVIMQEELQSQVLDHLQEVAQLREDHKNQMDNLQNNLNKHRRPRTRSDLSHSRRFSLDLSRYTSGNLKILVDWYEPRVMALLRRRQTAEEVLRRSRSLTEELRARLLPLQEEAHKLTVQRNSLEQRIVLMEREREESVTRYKESISCLEESMMELKTALQVQRMANTELKQLKNNLLLELQSYGCNINIGEQTDTASGEAEDL